MKTTTFAAVLVALALSACAGARFRLDHPEGDGAAAFATAEVLARAGWDAYLGRHDAETAGRRFEQALRRDPRSASARFGASLLARRRTDGAAEAAQLAALVEGTPDHPLAAIAARRLGELAELAPPLAQQVEAALARAEGRLRGLGAARARWARAAAAAALGDRAAAEEQRRRNGAATIWTVAGPFGAFHALELDTPFPPEQGTIPLEVAGPPALPAVPSRPLPTPDGNVVLEGEPTGADIYYLAVDVALSRGGDYLLTLGGAGTMRAFLDGAPVAERRAYAGYLPAVQVVPLALEAGKHRLLVKLGRGSGPAHAGAFLSRADGAPSDARFQAVAPGAAGPAVRPGPLPRALDAAAWLAAALEPELGPAAARLAAARDAMEADREAAKGLLEEALALAPGSAALLVARADAVVDDPSADVRVSRARAEADLDAALKADAGDTGARLRRAEVARAGGRLDDAVTLLDAVPPADAAQPRVLHARARLAQARGLAARAEGLAEEARRTGGDCGALELLAELAARRDAVARQDELVAALARCPGGLERTADHRRRRGDLVGALAAQAEVVRGAPTRLDARAMRAGLLAALGDPRAGAADLAELARLWPRDARIEKRRAELLDLAGDHEAARAARERALLLDGGDLGLRRALALERGGEPLDDLDEDGLAAIAAYRAERPAVDTSSVTVLDFGAVEAHPGGAYTERVHTVVEARDQAAVDRLGEVSVPEGALLLTARTVKRDGRVLEPEEPLGDKRTLSLTGLEPGDFAEWAWVRSVPARGAGLPGFTADAFYFRADSPLWRSTYVVAAPPSVPLEVDAHRMPVPEPRQEGGRTVLRALRERVPALVAEPGAAGDAEQFPFLQVGAGARPEALARGMGDALLDVFRPNREVRALAAEIAAGVPPAQRGGEALVRAAYRRVSELVQGQGGSFAEPASAVLSRGRGSRTVLLKSVLDVLGVRTRVALVRDFTRDPAPHRFPRPDLYGYALLRVEHGGRTTWLDPTARGAPYGALPAAVRGCEALVLPAPGEAVEVARTPAGPAERRTTRLAVALDESGGATLEGEEVYQGYEAAALRGSIEQLDAEGRRQAIEQALARQFRGVTLDRLSVDGEGDPEVPLVVRWRARSPRWARIEGDQAVADVPLFAAQLGGRFLQRAHRETILLVPVEERSSLTVTVTPPPGWKVVPAPPADLSSRYGSYHRAEHVEEGRLIREDRYDLERGRVPPAEYREFASFAGSLDVAQQIPMVFLRPTQGPQLPTAALR